MAQFNNNADLTLAALVAQVYNAFHSLILYKVGYAAHQIGFIHLIGNLVNDNALALAVGFKMGAAAHKNLTATGKIRLLDSVGTVNFSSGGEVGSFYELHQISHLSIGVFHQVNHRINHLTKVVRRNIGCHTNGNTYAAVTQKVGETAGENGRLF